MKELWLASILANRPEFNMAVRRVGGKVNLCTYGPRIDRWDDSSRSSWHWMEWSLSSSSFNSCIYRDRRSYAQHKLSDFITISCIIKAAVHYSKLAGLGYRCVLHHNLGIKFPRYLFYCLWRASRCNKHCGVWNYFLKKNLENCLISETLSYIMECTNLGRRHAK